MIFPKYLQILPVKGGVSKLVRVTLKIRHPLTLLQWTKTPSRNNKADTTRLSLQRTAIGTLTLTLALTF